MHQAWQEVEVFLLWLIASCGPYARPGNLPEVGPLKTGFRWTGKATSEGLLSAPHRLGVVSYWVRAYDLLGCLISCVLVSIHLRPPQNSHPE